MGQTELRLRNKETYETGLAVLANTNEGGDVSAIDEGRSESCDDGD